MNPVTEDMLMHYGVKRRSGRYPYGSGDDPYQRTGDLISRYDSLLAEGKSEKEIAELMGSTTTKLRAQLAYAKGERRALKVDRAKSLRSDGKTLMEIADIMDLPNESSVRSLLNANSESRMKQAKNTADRDQLASQLTGNVRAANSIYPTTMKEYEHRREYQNRTIVNCELLIKELQRVVDIFEVDVNIYGEYIKAIDREIGLIKKWRQRDNKIKSYVG